MAIDSTEVITVLISILCGSLLGIEREYHNKSAGFRTMILICLGSTLFTMVSQKMGGSGSDDRVAANIITGIGFIGAGVIFKNNFSVTGLTTASVIWISAAVGMMIGIKEYQIGMLITVFVLVILSLFVYVETIIDIINHKRLFTLVFHDTDISNLEMVEKMIVSKKLKSRRKQVSKRDARLIVTLEVYGNKKRIKRINEVLLSIREIIQF
ncbi:MAG: hypothetical protein JWN56_1227 [Sphingobacteriales bacterium]|nr:hypothetical protein [Sphingobacteriales bacterium]